MESENTPINSKACVICNNVEGDLISMHLKGLQSFIEYSKIRSNGLLLNYLTEQERNNIPNEVFVHKNCRRDYTNPLRSKQKQQNVIDDSYVKSTVLRSERKSFNWRTHGFFYGEVCVIGKKHPNPSKGWYKVGTLSFQTSILSKCHERADKWADDPLRWLSISIDLVASDATYHGQCESNFFFKKYMPTTKGTETEHTPGCRTDNAMKSNFEKICKWFDEQTELFTVSELHAKICSFAEKNTYQNSIFFTVEPSCSNIVCFTDMASTILSEQWYKDRKENSSDEKLRIIIATANLIEKLYVYPSKADIELGAEFLPPTLKLLMKVLVWQSLQQASLDQCILKAVKPKCYTSSIIWVRCRNRPCYWFKNAIDRNFKVGICYLL